MDSRFIYLSESARAVFIFCVCTPGKNVLISPPISISSFTSDTSGQQLCLRKGGEGRGGVVFLHQAIVWHQQMPYNFTQFWHYLPGESIWSHRSRGSVLQDWPSLQMLINGPGYYLCFWWPGVNQRFPGPSHGLDWSGTVAHRTRANCLLTRLPDY